jgi:pSer/pThr/pTyr-binding forkhead associated (FHA) protein
MKLIVIGRGHNVHIKLNSQFVSDYHAELLFLDNGEILLTDKGSKNGTYLNERRLQPNKEVSIKRGDVIRLADQVLDWKSVPVFPIFDISKVRDVHGIGTNFRNKYQIQGDLVSRFHATLTKKNDKKWYIQDHSKNGTTINGKKIPSNQDIKLKRGDKILCAGIHVPNPYGERGLINYKKIVFVIFAILFFCLLLYAIIKLYDNFYRNSDEDIYVKYKNSVVLLFGSYYYNVSAGNLDLKKLNFPTDVVLEDDNLKIVDKSSGDNMKQFTGTGFFVSNDGKIVTNLHIIRPWLYSKDASKISDKYKMILSQHAEDYPILNAFVSQIKVEGVMSYIGMLPNGVYFSEDNLHQCRELIGHNDIEKDVAILQLETKKIPYDNYSIVNIDQAVDDDSEIKVGSHIYTIGFPFGLSLQDLKTSKGIRSIANEGSITQECSEYSFGFNAPAYSGASGSPIFNSKGRLIGVLNSGVTKTQGFNYGIKAIYIRELLNKVQSKK